jgi:hypothetical protein
MPAEEELTLARAAGATLVMAMMNGTWDSARAGIASVFMRHDPDVWASVEGQLDANAALMKRSGDVARTRLLLAELWQLEFGGLLARNPGAAEDLAVWAISTQASLPGTSQVWTQTNTAHDHGVINAVLHGNQYNHYMDSTEGP